MAADVTPTKSIQIDCFICQRSGIKVTYRLNGTKISNFDLRSKFIELVGDEFSSLFDSISGEASVCRNCLNSISRFHDFQLEARSGVKSFKGKCIREKRMANFSPEQSSKEYFTTPTSNIEQHTHEDSDHTYASDKRSTQFRRRSLFAASRDQKVLSEFGLDRLEGHDSTDPKEQRLKTLLLEIDNQTKGLLDRKNPSSLLGKKSMLELSNWPNFCNEIIEELKSRVPFLLDILYTVCKPVQRQIDEVKIRGSIAVAFAVLMFTKDAEFSAVQRMLTAICIRGRAEDMTLTRLNRVGITMSTSTKIRLLDECAKSDRTELICHLKEKPLLKITGDNLDVFIRSSSQSINSPNTDLHLFASNALSSRISTMDLDNRQPAECNVSMDKILMDETSKQRLLLSYKHLISRILVDQCDIFSWMTNIIPKHLPHPYQREMAMPTKIFQLPIMFKNEAKYEDCIDIMDKYESTLEDVFISAHGNTQTLDKFGCVLGGDQLTRVRMEGAKDLRLQSSTKKEKLEHLDPIVCELWHLKADFLEKLFKTFFKSKSADQPGTLSYYRNLLRKTGVNGKVKSNYQAHAEFLILVVKELVHHFSQEILMASPSLIPPNIRIATREMKKDAKDKLLNELTQMFSSPSTPSDDYLFNYTSQLLEWGMLFLSLDDAAKEGDITRTIPHLKKCIPFFFSHSKLSKYLVECINFILQYEHASPLNKMRILEGSFVNRRGGSGMNVEADLVQEHAVRHQKELIRGLGANKTESAIKRATGASNLLSLVVGNFDRSLSVPQKSPNHTTSVNKEDVQIIRSAIESVKPLHHTPGRPCHSFHFLSPKFEVEQTSLLQVITKVKERIERGLGLVVDDDDNGDDVNLDNQ